MQYRALNSVNCNSSPFFHLFKQHWAPQNIIILSHMYMVPYTQMGCPYIKGLSLMRIGQNTFIWLQMNGCKHTHYHTLVYVHVCYHSSVKQSKYGKCMYTATLPVLLHYMHWRVEPSLFFFHLLFFSAILFSLTYFSQYFGDILAVFLNIINYVFPAFFSIRDCYIRVIHNMVTTVLESLDLSAVFLWT